KKSVIVAATEGQNYSVITYPGVENTPNANIANDKVASFSAGFRQLAATLSPHADGTSNAAQQFMLAATLAALDNQGPEHGTPAFQFPSTPAELANGQNLGSTFAGDFLQRILESDASDFQLGDIGVNLETLDELQQKLDAISGIDAELFESNGNACLDLTINRSLGGTAAMGDLLTNGGLIAIGGDISLEVDVHGHLIFGSDNDGFYVLTNATSCANDPNAAPASGTAPPEIVISNLRGTLSGGGRLGPLEVTFTDATLAVDSDVKLEIDLLSEVGSTNNGILRLEQLFESPQQLVSANLIGDPNDDVPDLSISAHVSATLFNTPLLQDRQIGFAWPDINNLLEGSLITTPCDANTTEGCSTAQDLLQLVQVHADDIIAGINLLADSIESATGTDVLAAEIPLIHKSLGELLNSSSALINIPDVDRPERSIADVSEVTVVGDDRFFTLSFNELDPESAGISVGDSVQFATVDGQTADGEIVAVTPTGISVRASALLNTLPDLIAPSISIQQNSSPLSRLRNLLGTDSVGIPTIQELVHRLSVRTGIDLFNQVELVGSLAEGNLAISLPLMLTPDPIEFEQRLDLGDRIQGLNFDASANFQIEVAPSISAKLGISVMPNVALRDRVFLFDNPTDDQGVVHPEVTLDITARLNDPEISGNIGFLNVSLSEDPNAPLAPGDTNEGLELQVTASLDLTDPAGAADHRLTLNELINDLSGSIDFDVEGFLDVDGLVLSASIGDSTQIGALRLSIDGESANGAGRIHQLSDLARVLSPATGAGGLVIDGELTIFESFQNISAAQIFAGLQFIVDQLHEAGRGQAFDRQIPLVNRSLSDLIDLGQVWSEAIGSPESANSIATAASLTTFLNGKLGTAQNPNPVSVTIAPGEILFDLDLQRSFQHNVPLGISVGSQGMGLLSDGTVQLNACADLGLTLGVSTAANVPVAERLFIDTSQTDEISVRLLANAGYQSSANESCSTSSAPLNVTASVGPLALNIVQARALVDVTIAADLQGNDDKLTLGQLSDVSLSPRFQGSVQAIVPIDGDRSGSVNNNPAQLATGDALIELGGSFTSLADLNFAINSDPTTTADDLPHNSNRSVPLTSQQLQAVGPDTIRVVTHHLTQLVESQFLNFSTLISGLEQFIEWAQGLLGADILDHKLPFIGKSLHDGLNFLESDRPGAVTLRTLVDTLQTDGKDGLVANASNAAVQEAIGHLRGALRKLPGVRAIIDGDEDGEFEDALALEDGRLVLASGDDLVRIIEDENGIQGVTFYLQFAPEFQLQLPFDLGLDFMRVQASASGNVVFDGSLDLRLGFGIDRDHGFFIDTNLPGPEFAVSGAIAPDVDLALKLGILDVTASLNPSTSYMTVGFAADLEGT
ncbi:MAG: hypothetical protein KDB23_20680, partial [Planctomycetales bacterium]|nr:hypothetical protein [Planctomycetales bacterium]